MPTFKGKDYDRELTKHDVEIDRAKPDPAPRELSEAELHKLGDPDRNIGGKHKRVVGR